MDSWQVFNPPGVTTREDTSQETGSRPVAIVRFRQMEYRIASSWFDLQKKVFTQADSYSACIVTVLIHSARPSAEYVKRAELNKERSNKMILPAWEWRPAFWSWRNPVDAAIDLLATGAQDPVYWAMGRYDGNEIPGLASKYDLGEGIRRQLHDIQVEAPLYLQSHGAYFILREQDAKELPWCRSQGGLGTLGTRVATFSSKSEPLDAYLAWQQEYELTRPSPFDVWTDSDTEAPAGATGWISPFGGEDRNHAVIAMANASADEIARNFADALGLPLIECNCSEREYRKWEWDNSLPRDLEEQLHKDRGMLLKQT